MKENSKRVDPYKKDYSSKSKIGSNIFERRTKNNKTFVGRKRNLWDENSNLWDENSNLRKYKEKLLDENNDLFDENNQLKNEKDDLLDENNQLQDDIYKINKELNKKKEKYKALKKKNKNLKENNEVLREDNKNLYKKNKNLDEQNNYMRNLLSYFGIWFNEDGKQISNNTENQQMLNSFISPWIKPNESSLSNGLNRSADNQEQKPIPQTSFSQSQK